MGRLVRRVLSFFRSDGHLSRTLVAQCLERPTRELGRAALKRPLFGLAPNEVYLADLITQFAGGLLHHRFTLTLAGGLLSVALSLGLPRVGVTHHFALWSPDVPRQ